MKRIIHTLLTFLLLTVSLPSWASAFFGEWIIYQGEKWIVLDKPIEKDSMLTRRLADFLPDDICYCMANRSGYTATWKIVNSELVLDYLETETTQDTLTFSSSQLQPIFHPYVQNGQICARWFNGTLRIAKGKVVKYIHDGYLREYETECILTIQEGTVIDTHIYHNSRASYTLIGKVYGEEVRQTPPYDVIKTPASGAYLTINGKQFKGWIADSTGTFRIEHLEKGLHRLKATFIGLNPCDTLLSIPLRNDTLQLTLSLPYDHIKTYHCSPALSRTYIDQGKANLKIIIPVKNMKKIQNHPFWKKYGVTYYSSYPLQENGKLKCYLGTPSHLLRAYNEEVFRYLDKKFGKEWRKETPPGIFGIDKSLDELRDKRWLIQTLHRRGLDSIIQVKKDTIDTLRVAYEVNEEGYITNFSMLDKTPRRLRKTIKHVLQSLKNVPMILRPGRDTLSIQFHTDSLSIPKEDACPNEASLLINQEIR